MISHQRDNRECALTLEPKNLLDTPLRIRPAIDVVAQEDQRVVRTQLGDNLRQQIAQRRRFSMYVPDGDNWHTISSASQPRFAMTLPPTPSNGRCCMAKLVSSAPTFLVDD